MRYKYDDALEFLQYCSNNELDYYVKLFKNNGKITEALSSESRYEKHFPNHKKYWDLIAAELQYFGGNTVSNLSRGNGVLYKEILCDVCDEQLISYDRKADVAQIEKVFVWHFLETNIKKMNKTELDNFKLGASLLPFDEFRLLNEAQKRLFSNESFFKNITTDLLNNLGKAIVGKGFKAFVPLLSSKVVGFPFGVALGIKDLTDPAFRVTLPSVVYTAYLREKYKKEDSEFRIKSYPKVGSIVRTELMGDIVDHSGIYISENEIVEIFNDGGTSVVKNVTYEEFTYGSSLRTGTTIYIAIDRLTKEVICNDDLAKNAKKHISKTRNYELVNDNCHSFVYKCIKDFSFDRKVSIVLFDDLTKSISKHLNEGREVAWVVCDINPLEYKRKNTWKIEDEVV